MTNKILELLKTKYAHLGFNDEVLKGVATNLSAFVSEETQIEPAVNGAESMLKSFQSFADGRVGSFRKEIEKYKAENQTLKNQLTPPNNGKSSENDEEVPAWAKALMESNKTLQTSLSQLQKEKENQSFTSAFAQKMNEKGVPEIFYKTALRGREFADNEQVSKLADEIATDYQNFQTESAKHGFSYTKPPEPTQNPTKEDEAFAEIIKQGTKQIVEQSKI